MKAATATTSRPLTRRGRSRRRWSRCSKGCGSEKDRGNTHDRATHDRQQRPARRNHCGQAGRRPHLRVVPGMVYAMPGCRGAKGARYVCGHTRQRGRREAMTTMTEMRARIANKRASYEDSAEWRHEEIEALMAENTDLAAELNATRLMCTQNGRERDRAHADLEAWARAIPDECCAVTAKDRSVAADGAAEWRRRYNDLKRQNDALVELVKYAAESSTVTTSDNPGCFWCDRESPKHARCCPP